METENVSIKSAAGLAAKDWVLSYYDQAILDDALPPSEFFQRCLGRCNGISSDMVSQIKGRYWMYITMLQLALNDKAYCDIQAELMQSLQSLASAKISDNVYRFQHEGLTYSFSLNKSKVIFQCGDDFSFSLYYALCAKLDVILGSKEYIMQLKDVTDTHHEYTLIRQRDLQKSVAAKKQKHYQPE